MQKKFIALAVAGLVSGAAFAQSNVTVYGVADADFENVSATGATGNGIGAANTVVNAPGRTRVMSNSSYIGFKGTEALGNGLSAVFQIETQFALDNAQNSSAGATANSLANRDSFVGLTGGFGTAILGYVSTPYRSLGAKFDVMPGATGVAGFNGLVGHVNVGATQAANGTTANTFAGTNNLNGIGRTQAAVYVTPTMSGFNGTVAYTSNETKSVDTANSVVPTLNPYAWNLAVNYDNGPLKAGYSYLDSRDAVAQGGTGVLVANTGSTLKAHLLAAGYTFNGATTLNAMWNSNRVTVSGVAGAVGANELKNAVWYLGLKHVMGQHEIAGMYARATDGSVGNTAGGTANADNRGANQFGVRYAYNLSKRSQVYALYSRISNSDNGNYDFGAGTSAANSSAATIGAGANPEAFGVGMRHSF